MNLQELVRTFSAKPICIFCLGPCQTHSYTLINTTSHTPCISRYCHMSASPNRYKKAVVRSCICPLRLTPTEDSCTLFILGSITQLLCIHLTSRPWNSFMYWISIFLQVGLSWICQCKLRKNWSVWAGNIYKAGKIGMLCRKIITVSFKIAFMIMHVINEWWSQSE